MENSERSAPVVRLNARDNVAVLFRTLKPEEAIEFDGVRGHFPHGLGLGHKIALQAIAAGEKIVKFGAPIGSATRAIGPGEHVHVHNMKSDYLPTHTLNGGGPQ